MSAPTFDELYARVAELLGEKRLSEAIKVLQDLIGTTSDWQLLDELENIKSSYLSLLNCVRLGLNDPERESQYLRFVASCYDIAEKASVMHCIKSRVVQTMRPMSGVLKDLEDLGMKGIVSALDKSDREKHYALYDELFNLAGNPALWSADACRQAEEVMNSAFVSDNDKLVMVSGLVLSCLYAFDARKIEFLVNQYCITEDAGLRMQLLVSFVLPVMKYKERIFAYKSLQNCHTLLLSSPFFSGDIEALQILLLESLSTHEVNRKLRDEIIPSMLKGSNLSSLKFGFDKIEDIGEANPEWQKIDKTMGELAELEASGADVYYATFSSLKHFPFFQKKANWFYPYDSQHVCVPDIISENGGKGIVKILLDSDAMCDSDKYSFSLLTSQMSEQQISLIASQVPGMEEASVKVNSTKESACRNILRNMFRFFYLYSGDKPSNPFEGDIVFWNAPFLKDAFNNAEGMRRIASRAIEMKNWEMALLYLENSLELGKPAAETYQKIGFCYQKQKLFIDALTAYEKANDLDGNSRWTLNRLGQLFLIIGDVERAYGFYNKLESLDPENARVAYKCGQCLVDFRKYSDALNEFFKAEYLDPEYTAPKRAIAWCSVLTGNFKQARQYYEKILSVDAQTDDFISAGHAAWIDGDLDAAMGYYSQAAKKESAESFSKKFLADINTLSSHGIDSQTARLIAELVILGNS